MESDRDRSERAWLALSCTHDGAIVQILRDDLGIAKGGARLADIVDSGSAAKAVRLIATIVEQQNAAGWYLNVPSGDAARPLWFAGGASGDSLLILAAPRRDSAAALFDELAGAHLAGLQGLRALLDEERAGITASLSRDNQLYEELSRLNNELINRERELARKTAALERLSAEKTRMAAIAAHDLRNPLTVIVSYADLLRMEGAVDGEHATYVDEIARSARFMMELVEEMLDASRIESGRVEVDLQPIDLVNAARHAATINRIRAERKEIRIAFEHEAERAIIKADAVKLRQIVNNLVVNAIKFSPSGTTVTIRARCTPTVAVLEVIDEGIGIPRDKLATIFEAFETLGARGTAGEKSTGLGLAIVKQLADLHRASIEVESEPGRGSCFRVAFPLHP